MSAEIHLSTAITALLEQSNLSELSKKKVRAVMSEQFPNKDLTDKKVPTV
jgi:predicted transcriptional regulator